MAYDLSGGTNHYLSASDPVDATPLTMACWFRVTSLVSQNLLWLSNNGNVSQASWGMYINTALRAYVGAGGSASDFAATTNPSTNTWHHACLSAESDSSRTVFLDGGSSATNTATRNVNAASIVGLRMGWTPNSLIGLIAEVGVWNAALTAAEIASLAKGMTCDKVRPQSLVFYAPLVRDLQDVRGGLTITNNNAATVANHPRVYA
jgi:hypothetical protein